MKRLLLLCALAALVLFILLSRTSCGKAAEVGPAAPSPTGERQPEAKNIPENIPALARVSFPTRTPRVNYLPDTKAVNDWIDWMNNSGGWKWYRSDIEWKIGFELHIKTCTRSAQMPADTMVDYILRFYRVEEDSDEFVGTIDIDPINAGMRERKVTDAQWGTFSVCANAYLASHTWSSADYPNDEIMWGSGTLFPIGTDPLYARLRSMGVEIPGL